MKTKNTRFKFKPVKIGEYKVIDVDYHRNGVGGLGFYTGLIQNNKDKNKFLFTLFSSFSGWVDGKQYVEEKEETYENIEGDYRCAVLCLNHVIENDNVQSAWRGDVFYHDVVQGAVQEYQKQNDKYYGIKE